MIFLCFFINNLKQQKINNSGIYFSHPSGFYANDFDLEIKGNGDIYYTLDGSIPTENSIKYTGPVHISDASKNQNIISMRENDSVCYLESHLIPKPSKYRCTKFTPPLFLIDKATIIRARKISNPATSEYVNSASYFVGFNKKKGYKNIGIISMIVEPENFFDDTKGIYTMGNDMNFYHRGKSSERPAYIDLFDKDKNYTDSFYIGVRIRGGSTRELPKKSFNLYQRQKYNNKKSSLKSFIDTNYLPHTLTLFSGKENYSIDFDYIFHSLIKSKDIVTFNFKPYMLFLNGEYWGFYWITDKYDKYYISYLYSIKNPNNIIIIKNNKLEDGTNNDYKTYQKMIDFITSNDLTKDETFKIVNNLLDIDSFVKYYSIQIYLNNTDFSYDRNAALWRTRNISNKKYQDGKWRWLLFDLDGILLCPIKYMNKNKITKLEDKDRLYANLMKNKVIKNRLAQEIIKLTFNEFEPTKVSSFIEEYEKDMKDIINKDMERYYFSSKEYIQKELPKGLRHTKHFFYIRPIEIYSKYCNELDYSQEIDSEVKNVCHTYRNNKDLQRTILMSSN